MITDVTKAQQMTNRTIKDLERKEYGDSMAEVHTVEEKNLYHPSAAIRKTQPSPHCAGHHPRSFKWHPEPALNML